MKVKSKLWLKAQDGGKATTTCHLWKKMIFSTECLYVLWEKKTGGAGLPKLSGTQISPSGSPGADTELQDLTYVLLIFWLVLSNICLLCFCFLSEWKHLLCANICCKYVTFGGLTVKRFTLSLRIDFGLRTVLALLKTIGALEFEMNVFCAMRCPWVYGCQW